MEWWTENKSLVRLRWAFEELTKVSSENGFYICCLHSQNKWRYIYLNSFMTVSSDFKVFSSMVLWNMWYASSRLLSNPVFYPKSVWVTVKPCAFSHRSKKTCYRWKKIKASMPLPRIEPGPLEWHANTLPRRYKSRLEPQSGKKCIIYTSLLHITPPPPSLDSSPNLNLSNHFIPGH